MIRRRDGGDVMLQLPILYRNVGLQ